MRNTLFIGLLFSIFIGGCSSPTDNTEWSYAPLGFRSNIEITDSVRMGQPVEFRLDSWLGNSCWEYGHMNVEVDRDDVHIWFIQKMDMSQLICTDAIDPYEINESIPFIPPGRYNFHFWQNDSTSIDTVVIVY